MKIFTQQPIGAINSELAKRFIPSLGRLITEGIGPGQEVRLVISRARHSGNDYGDICEIFVETENEHKEEVLIVVRKKKPLPSPEQQESAMDAGWHGY